MSKPKGVGPAPTREINEGFIELLSTLARLLMYAGILATLISGGFLVYTSAILSGPTPPNNPDQALTNISILEKFLFGGVLALGASTTYMFWGESLLGAIQLLAAALLYFSPVILNIVGLVSGSDKGGGQIGTALTQSLGALSNGGLLLGIIGSLVLAVDLAGRARTRAQQGWKSDQIKYGKGVKEEADRHNVFLGKCWQLPFCRKFVRERCPIYHARRTCWKELTGCMCEEEVIRNAMENKAIPKDALMAASYIPRNLKLSVSQKQERCRSCVIYNEHQKHKYKVAMPATLLFFAAVYFFAHGPLVQLVSQLISTLDKLIGRATLDKMSANLDQPVLFQELLLGCLMIIMLAYAMKILEYLVFKLKM